MVLGAFATINTSSATIVNNHKYARGGRRDDFDAKRDGRQDGHSYLATGRAHILRSAHRIVLYYIYFHFYHQQSRPRCGRESKAGNQSHFCHTAEGKWDAEGWWRN